MKQANKTQGETATYSQCVKLQRRNNELQVKYADVLLQLASLRKLFEQLQKGIKFVVEENESLKLKLTSLTPKPDN